MGGGTGSIDYMDGLSKIIDARLFYNSRLKIISNSNREIFDYCYGVSGFDNTKFKKIYKSTPIVNFPRLQKLFLTKMKRLTEK